MHLYWRYIIFVISLIFVCFCLFVSYKKGKRQGIKKALYKITYRCLCVIIAFVLAPYVNEYILNYDLYDIEKYIYYDGMYFYRIIDFIEEVIVHHPILNDIYNLIPSLKNVLMDFPQVLFIPITYVLLFLSLSILFYPLYLFFSYRRKKRDLYERQYKDRGAVWAGILNAVQSVFLISIILTPINGLTRIYKEASKDLISKEENICMQNEYLAKYQIACELIEGYNSSVFAFVGRNPVNVYIYDSLTTVDYGGGNTKLSVEIVSVARAGLVLTKTGLLNAINADNFEDVTSLNFQGLTEEDIDVMVEAFENSLYTQDVVYEVYEWSKAYLDWLFSDYVKKDFQTIYSYDEMIKELKIILKAINYILDHPEALKNVKTIYTIINNYLQGTDTGVSGVSRDVKLFFDLVYSVNVDSLLELYALLEESRIYNDFIPEVLKNVFESMNVRFEYEKAPEDFNTTIVYLLNIAKMFQNHKYIYDIIHLIADLSFEEVHYIGKFGEFAFNSESVKYLFRDLLEYLFVTRNIQLEVPLETFYEIKDWPRELELVNLVMKVVYKAMSGDGIDYDVAWTALSKYHDTVLFEAALKFAIKLLPDVFRMWVSGKGFGYLVGEYAA